MNDSHSAPVVHRDGSPLVSVRGVFYRAIDPAHEQFALAGSRSAGRYSPEESPTLYLSSSREGVAAAMIKHAGDRAAQLSVLSFAVEAEGIADLRDSEAMSSLGINLDNVFGDWQAALAKGTTPPSWVVREKLEAAGANGLIDPSRKRPGLWHLTLFTWNIEGAPSVVRAWGKLTGLTTYESQSLGPKAMFYFPGDLS